MLLRDNEIDFTSIATTKKACDKARMTAEESASAWACQREAAASSPMIRASPAAALRAA